MNSLFYKKYQFSIIILLGFLISVFFSINNIKKYDQNVIDSNSNQYHKMIKYDSYRYLSHGNEIKNQINGGKNFFETGRQHYTKYLPARIAAAYYYFFDLSLFQDAEKKKINLGIHLPYLLFQCFFYFFSITFLYLSAKKILNKNTCLGLILFLCLEPTINQYHGSFWSESYLFSIMVILIGLIIRPNHNIVSAFFIGLLLGLLSLQKEYAIFYIIPVTFYFIFFYKYNFLKNIFFILVGFALMQCILGFNNYKRTGNFYILASSTKLSFHTHLVSPVMQKKLNMSHYEFFERIEGGPSLEWIEKNEIEYDPDHESLKVRKDLHGYRDAIKHEKDVARFDEFIFSRSINYFFENPLSITKYVLKNSFHITLLNPFHIYSDNKYISGEVYYFSNEHDKLVPYRIFYSLMIYFICLIGFISMIKEKNYKLLFFSLISIIYFFLPVSWIGNTRNFVPCLIFMSFFFAFGINKILSLKKTRLIY